MNWDVSIFHAAAWLHLTFMRMYCGIIWITFIGLFADELGSFAELIGFQ